MKDENRRVSEATTRMRAYWGGRELVFPPGSPGGERFIALGNLAEKIDIQGSRQAQEKGAAKAATERKDGLRIEIKRRMKEIRATSLSAESEHPGVSQNFNMPASNSDESLLEAARAFIAAATPIKPLFLARGMPEDFLDKLAEAVELFEAMVEDYNLHAANRAAATLLVDDACAQVLTIRRELDPIVRNKYRNDPESLALWETASHLERPTRRAASSKSDGTPTNPQT
jgi:hypothetical protein